MFAKPNRRVEAEEFILRDANGAVRAVLTMTLDGPGLFLHDQNGIVRAGLLVGEGEPGLALFDGLGRPRASLGLTADNPCLRLRDATGGSRVVVIVEESGTRLMLSDANSGPRVGVAAQGGETSLVFADNKGKPRVIVGTPGGVPGLSVLDEGDRLRAKLEVAENITTFEVYDADGKTSTTHTVAAVEPHLRAEVISEEPAAPAPVVPVPPSADRLLDALLVETGQLAWATSAALEMAEDSRLWRSFTGQTEEEVQGLGWMQAVHPEDRNRMAEVLEGVEETSVPQETECRVRRQDGEYRVFAVRSAPGAQGPQASQWVFMATDISLRKRAEESLRVSEERVATLVSTNTQLEQVLRDSQEKLNQLAESSRHLEESLRANEASSADQRQRLQDALRVTEEQLSIMSTASTQLEESLRAAEERVAALTASNTQLQASLQADATSQTSERQRLEEALQASAAQLAVSTTAKSQLEESLLLAQERVAAQTAANAQLQAELQANGAAHASERQRLEESLRASEEQISQLTAARSQLEQSWRAAEERVTELSASNTQLQEALRANEALYAGERQRLEELVRRGDERHNQMAAAKSQMEETLRVGEERLSMLSAANAKLQQSLQSRELVHASERQKLEEKVRASEARNSALTESYNQLLQTLHATETDRASERQKLEAELRESEARLSALAESHNQLLQNVKANEAAYASERLRLEEAVRTVEERLSAIAADKSRLEETLHAVQQSYATEQKELAERVSLLEKRSRSLASAAAPIVWTIDAAGEMLEAAPAWLTFTGQTAEEAQGRGWLHALHAEDRDQVEQTLAKARETGGAYQAEYRLRRHDGQYRQLTVSAAPVCNEDGSVREWVAAGRDVTEEKETEALRSVLEGRRLQTQKLQALGNFAGNVAHTFDNLFTIISGYNDWLLGNIPRNDPMRENLTQIKQACERASGVIEPLLTFSQGRVLRPRLVDLNTIVTESERSLRGQLGEGIQLATTLGASRGAVKADPRQLQEVLFTLASNARDAMGSTGNLVVETRDTELDEAYARQHPGVQPGPFVEIVVSDNGKGMSEDAVAHLFEPFFTTKKESGAGLSLAAVYGIINQSGGSVEVESAPGKGSTFHIFLPRVAETPVPEETAATPTPLRGTETILVVEDEEAIRKLAQVVLSSYGYQVLSAANGWEALMLSERHTGPVHLLLTDMMMPGMTGHELVDRFKPLRPEMKVLFMTGYVKQGTTLPAALPADTSFLAKPFSPDVLASKVREALGPVSSAGKVLVIDEDAGLRSFLRMVLGSVGYEVLEASDGAQALQQVNGESVSLVLVDLETATEQETEELRSLHERRPDIKLIAYSGAFRDDQRQAAQQLGARATLVKPIRADQLLEAVRQATE